MKLHLFRIYFLLFFFRGLLSAVAQPTEVGTITELLSLSRTEANKGCPVKMTGIITFIASWKKTAFILATEDDPNGIAIYVDYGMYEETPSQFIGLTKPQPGMVVTIEGKSNAGGFSPMVLASSVRLIKPTTLPPPPCYRLADFNMGCKDNQMATLEGIIRNVYPSQAETNSVTYEISTIDGLFVAHIMDNPDQAGESLIDAEVLLQGCAMSYFNQRSEFQGIHLEVSSAKNMSVKKMPPADPFSAKAVPIDELLPYSPSPIDLHRRKTQGVVTLIRDGSFLYLQHSNCAVRVNTEQTHDLKIGHWVEAVGFPSINRHFAELNYALCRKIGDAQVPSALSVDANELQRKMNEMFYTQVTSFDGRLITLRGKILKIEAPERNERRLFLSTGSRTFYAVIAKPIPELLLRELQKSPTVEMTGICVVSMESKLPSDILPMMKEFHLLLRDTDDIRIVHDENWVRQHREEFLQTVSIALMILFSLIIFVLLYRINRQHRKQTEINMIIDERKRMAADLHDTIEQDLTSAMMLLKTSLLKTKDIPPLITNFASMILQILDAAKTDIRHSVWDLRSDSLRDRSLAEILSEHTRKISLTEQINVFCDLPPLPQNLPFQMKAHLFSIVQEAITNTIKHAKASEINITASCGTHDFSLRIVDNGCGFLRAQDTNLSLCHFGLTGMQERARRIGGTLAIHSVVGKGTTITITCPLPAP